MKKLTTAILICLEFLLPLALKAQADTTRGIHFEQDIAWEQIKAKAKAEHKFIFVDCFATWCGPCKLMDKDVYPNDTVGQFMNAHFISVKMQLDTSKLDNEEVKTRYADAHEIMQQYKIKAFPTFLFFSPEDNIVHKGIGYQTTDGFIAIATDALNPDKQFYTLVDNYQNGKLSADEIPSLANLANALGEHDISKKITDDYIRNVLPKLKGEELYTKDNLVFFGEHLYLFSSNDRLFQYTLHHPTEADSLVHNPTYAKQVISIMINTEEIFNKLWKDRKTVMPFTRTPDWERIRTTIKVKYGYDQKQVDSLIFLSQVNFYSFIKDWNSYAHYVEIAMQKYPPTTNGMHFSDAVDANYPFVRNDHISLNKAAWTLFQATKDKALLKKALAWSELSLKIAPKNDPFNIAQYFDTKANLLYKLNGGKGSVNVEKQAIKTAKQLTDKGLAKIVNDAVNGFQETIAKMQKGQPTWPLN